MTKPRIQAFQLLVPAERFKSPGPRMAFPRFTGWAMGSLAKSVSLLGLDPPYFTDSCHYFGAKITPVSILESATYSSQAALETA